MSNDVAGYTRLRFTRSIYWTCLTVGIGHVPSMIEGGFSFGQYIRNISTNCPAGAGSQFASLSLPGEGIQRL
jgi:hypothetical protein